MDAPADPDLVMSLLVKARKQAAQQSGPAAAGLFREALAHIDLAAADVPLQAQLAWTALAVGDIAFIGQLLNAQHGGDPLISVTREEERRGGGERSAILCRLSRDGSLSFSLPASHPQKSGGVRLLATRFIQSVPMFIACARQKLVREGAAILNVADAARYASVGYCANIERVMLVPDPDYLASYGYRNFIANLEARPIAWEDRERVAFWRGATTGHSNVDDPRWMGLQRVKLCQVVQGEHAALFNAGISRLQLPKDDPGNDEIRDRGYMKPFVSSAEFHKFRYQIDIDGYTSAWSALFTKLATGSTVLKVGSRDGWRQWYYDRLVPWENYVPVDAEMGDLAEKTQWLIDHDDDARRIGANGRALALSMTYDSQIDAAAKTIARWMRMASPVDGRIPKRMWRKAA